MRDDGQNKYRLLLPGVGIALVLASACAGSQKPKAKDLISSLRTEQYEDNGWWQSGGRSGVRAYARVERSQLAVSSQYCANRYPESQNCASFDEIDLAAGTDRRESLPFVRDLANLERDVRYFAATNASEWETEIRDLLAECKIIRRVIVSSHGEPGRLIFGDPPQVSLQYTSDFLLNRLNPCALSQYAQIQMSICDQGCRDVVPSLREAFGRIYQDARFTPAAGGRPFRQVRLLLNTTTGGETSEMFRRIGFPVSTGSQNDLGLEFTVTPERITQDLRTETIPACRSDSMRGFTAAHMRRLARPVLSPAPDMSGYSRVSAAGGGSGGGSGSSAR